MLLNSTENMAREQFAIWQFLCHIQLTQLQDIPQASHQSLVSTLEHYDPEI
jgi:hypothetical protein